MKSLIKSMLVPAEEVASAAIKFLTRARQHLKFKLEVGLLQ